MPAQPPPLPAHLKNPSPPADHAKPMSFGLALRQPQRPKLTPQGGWETFSRAKKIAVVLATPLAVVGLWSVLALLGDKSNNEPGAPTVAAIETPMCGKRPPPSPWDHGNYRVEQYLKDRATDPDSIDTKNCTEPKFSGEPLCWVVSCEVRGANVSGGKAREHMTFSLTRTGVSRLK